MKELPPVALFGPDHFDVEPGELIDIGNAGRETISYTRSDLIPKQIEEAVKPLQAQLDAANELIEELGEALEDLLDHQNGCPLPKYEIPWNRAVESSRTALNKWRALKGHDEREVTG